MSYTFDGEYGFDLAQKKYQTTGRKIACEANSESWRVFVCVLWFESKTMQNYVHSVHTNIQVNKRQPAKTKQTNENWVAYEY